MKAGDYVRTKDGIILKIKDIEDIYTTDNIYIGMAIYDDEGHFVNDVEIIKSNSNIIDLIEVGDYVNGCMVINKKDDTLQIIQLIIPFDLKEKDIKSIVTKECFESMEYKVGE